MTQQPFSPQTGPQQTGFQQFRRLHRSHVDRKVGGVCAGIGEYFEVDPTFVRVAFVVLTVLTGGAFLLAYLFAFRVMPDQQPVPVWNAYTGAPTNPNMPPAPPVD